MRLGRVCLVLSLAGLPVFPCVACSTFGSTPSDDAGAPDAVAPPDGASPPVDGSVPPPDAPPPDGGAPPPDATTPDVGIPDASDSDAPLPPVDAGPPLQKRVFVTSQTYQGNLRGSGADALAAADAFCLENATSSIPGSTWRAYLSTPTVAAVNRLPTNVTWHLPLSGPLGPFGAVVFYSRDAIKNGPLTPISVDASGIGIITTPPLPQRYVWTGTSTNTNPHASTCNGWIDEAAEGMTGDPDTIGATWTERDVLPCGKGAQLYCFEL